jgi:glutathione synthase/RimK-type ligase-like ATP-grasp enzyme
VQGHVPRRILIIGAGTGPANNLICSLRAGDASLVILGCHSDRFALKQSSADRNYLVTSSTRPGFAASLRAVVEAEAIDLVLPTTDADVRALAGLSEFPCRLVVPKPVVVDLCQDKYALTALLAERGVPVPATAPITDLETIEEVFTRVSRNSRAWCRLRSGQGALGALLIRSAEGARRWIRLWEELRDTPPSAFVLAEYLPGRDVAAQTLWDRGRLVLVKTYERLTYLGAGGPGGFSSIAALSKAVVEPRIVETCARAIPALDPEASGVFVFDFKEDAAGIPHVTEINAGRFGMSTNIFDLPGKHNMAATYVRLALGDPVDVSTVYDAVEDYYMVRDVDTTPGVYHADEFFEGIEDART